MKRPSLARRFAWRIGSMFRAAGGGAVLPPWDDYWYGRPGISSASGMNVTPETAMRLSAVYACVRVRGETLGSLPLIVYRRLPNGGKERAPEHPLYNVLHDKPNQNQNSMEFVEMLQGHIDLRGNAFARILPGPRGAIDQLIPIHPDLVQVYRLPNGKLQYRVRSRFSAEVDVYMQDEIFHLRGRSSDGLVGLSPVSEQAETFGNGLAMQDHAGRFFRNGMSPSGVLAHPGHFKDDGARKKFKESVREDGTGENKHSLLVVEEGMKYSQIGLTNKDSQFLEAVQATDEKICGIYRVPPHMTGQLQRSTNNNIEQQSIDFVVNCIRPMAVRWERRINNDLIDPVTTDGEEYFAEFLVDGILRGDLQSRYEAYQIGRNGGWLCPDDIRRFENMNPIGPEKGGEDYLRPINYTVAGAEAPNPAAPGAAPDKDDAEDVDDPPPDDPDDEGHDAEARRRALQTFASDAAGRVVRKEVSRLRDVLKKSATAEEFEASATEFYREHVPFVSASMHITPTAAYKFCADHLSMLRNCPEAADRSTILDWIEDTAPDALAELAIGATTAPRALPAPKGSFK